MTASVVPHLANDQGVEKIFVGVRELNCMGARPPFDHPHVYLDMGDDGQILCPYCSTLYRYRADLGPAETDPPGGGQGLAWADAARMLKDHFGPGTLLLATSQSGTNIGVLASPLKTMLVNKTNQTLVVAVNGVHVTLNPYRVMLIDTPPMIGPGPTPTPPPPVGDTTGPVVTITNPRNDSRVAVGTTITIRADVTDNVGVSVVNFFINDALVCSDTDLGYKCDWPVPPAKGAVYTIRVQAIDLADNRTNRTITVTGR